MARLMATEQAGYAVPKGMQKLGGYGHESEYDMERHLRAAVVFSALVEGTDEIRRDINGGIHGF